MPSSGVLVWGLVAVHQRLPIQKPARAPVELACSVRLAYSARQSCTSSRFERYGFSDSDGGVVPVSLHRLLRTIVAMI